MEAAVNRAEVLASPQAAVTDSCPDEGPQGQAVSIPAAPAVDPMEDLSQRLEDILSTYGTAAILVDQQTASVETQKMEEEEPGSDVTNDTGKEESLVIQSLNKLLSQDEKLETLMQKYSELAAVRGSEKRRLCVLQHQVSSLQREQEKTQAEYRRGVLARSQLESLCRELQKHNKTLQGETLRRCREDEEKRKEVSAHFQTTLNEIQTQIEQYSGRNNKLCQENALLADKLDGLMHQYEQREESLEKVNHHRELQHKLTEAKLEQANALLAEAEAKHLREKEYLLREAIDKTKKCFAMKEQELAMKKKLTLYSQKFDEFQETLAKSNDIYVSFKQEMDKMTKKMKKMEKESSVWKDRFESCNKALADMITERSEKGKEFEPFVLKIQKLEVLCRALQEERKVLYDKIKDVSSHNAKLPSLISQPEDGALPGPQGETGAPALTETDFQELQELQEKDPVLTEDMARLRAEQARLQDFAASLLAPSNDTDEDDEDDEESEDDAVASAFDQFKTKKQEETLQDTSETGPTAEPGPVKGDEVQKTTTSDEPAAAEPTQEEASNTTRQPFETAVVPEPRSAEPQPQLTVLPRSAEPQPQLTVLREVQPRSAEPQPQLTGLKEVQLSQEQLHLQGDQRPCDPVPTPEPASDRCQDKPLECNTTPLEAYATPPRDSATPPGDNATPPEDNATPPGDNATQPESNTAPKEAVPAPLQQPISTDSSKKQASKKKKKNAKKAS